MTYQPYITWDHHHHLVLGLFTLSLFSAYTMLFIFVHTFSVFLVFYQLSCFLGSCEALSSISQVASPPKGGQLNKHTPAWMHTEDAHVELMCCSRSLSLTEVLMLSLLMSVLCLHLSGTHYGLSAWLFRNYTYGEWQRCNVSAVVAEPLLTGSDCQQRAS